MNKPKIWLSSPHLSGLEQEYVRDAIDSNWIAPLGPYVDLFEENLKRFCQVSGVALLISGTAAIHLGLKLIGVAQNDIVLCQSFTFSASANPILYEKATPVFIDSELETWNMCPNLLEEAIVKYVAKGKKPKAIIVVHLYGMPANMDKIVALAGKFEIPILEDAAEALGSNIDGKPCGSFSEFGVLSFNGNKIITTSGGGALLSNNEEAIEKARFLASQAKDFAPHYQHSEIGYNYRLSNISAAIGVAQLSIIKDRVASRRENYEYYLKQLSHIEGFTFLSEPTTYFSNRWLTTLTVDPSIYNLDIINLALAKENIESRPLWKPMHIQPIFMDCDIFGGEVSENLFNKGICLPSGSNLTLEEKERVISVIISSINS